MMNHRMLWFAATLLGVAVSAFGQEQAVVKRGVYNREPAVVSEIRTREVQLHREPTAGIQSCAIALVPGLEVPSPEWSITAFRFDVLLGRHHSVSGVDFGIVGNLVDYDLAGFGFAAGFNDCGMADSAFQLAGVFNHVSWNYRGLQVAGGANVVEGELTGMQMAVFNSAERLKGLQLGAINSTTCGSGVQVGVINTTERLKGVQIGAINIIRESSFPFLPIINCAF